MPVSRRPYLFQTPPRIVIQFGNWKRRNLVAVPSIENHHSCRLVTSNKQSLACFVKHNRVRFPRLWQRPGAFNFPALQIYDTYLFTPVKFRFMFFLVEKGSIAELAGR